MALISTPVSHLLFGCRVKCTVTHKGGYIIGQFLGAIIGAVLLVFVWGKYAANVNNGMTLPGQNYALWYVFLAEIIITFMLVLAIFIFVSSDRLQAGHH